jgi:hypothetical protein
VFSDALDREEAEAVARDLRFEFQDRDGTLRGRRKGDPGWAVNLWAASVVVVPARPRFSRPRWEVVVDGATVPSSHAVCRWLNRSWGQTWVEDGRVRALWRPWTSGDRGLFRTCRFERTVADEGWPEP